jgi:hypothetical protein
VITGNIKHIFTLYYTGDRGRAYIPDLRFVFEVFIVPFCEENKIIFFLLLYYSVSPLVMSLTGWRPKGGGHGYVVIKIINVIVL